MYVLTNYGCSLNSFIVVPKFYSFTFLFVIRHIINFFALKFFNILIWFAVTFFVCILKRSHHQQVYFIYYYFSFYCVSFVLHRCHYIYIFGLPLFDVQKKVSFAYFEWDHSIFGCQTYYKKIFLVFRKVDISFRLLHSETTEIQLIECVV